MPNLKAYAMNHYNFEFEYNGARYTGEVTVSLGGTDHFHVSNLSQNPFDINSMLVQFDREKNKFVWGIQNPNSLQFVGDMIRGFEKVLADHGINFPSN